MRAPRSSSANLNSSIRQGIALAAKHYFACAVQWANEGIIMNKKFFTAICGLVLAAFALNSCDTPTGQGAAAGAGAGAIIGGIAGGGPRSAAIGAAIGAASGALIGHAIQEDRAREYGPPPAGGYPFGRRTDRPG